MAHYHFDGSGFDQSGNENHANLNGSVTESEDRFGSPAEALVMKVRDEISTVLEDSGIHFDSGATVSGWVKVTSLNGKYPRLMGVGGDCGSWGFTINMGNGADPDFLNLYASNSMNCTAQHYSQPFGIKMELNQWVHLVSVIHGNDTKGFINGIHILEFEAEHENVFEETPKFRIGNAFTDPGGRPAPSGTFDGVVDDYRIYNRPLSDEEVLALYHYESNPSNLRLGRATAEAQIVNGFFIGVDLLDPGYGYADPPPHVTVLDSQGTGAEVVSIVKDGRVVGFEILNTGRGYSENTIVQIEPPPFAPEMSIRVKSIELNLHLVIGKSYVIEATDDFIQWTPVSDPFVADNEFMAFEYEVDAHGKYYRVVEAP